MKKPDWRRHYHARVDVRCGFTHLYVEKRSGRDGISWDVLQRIKNELVGEDVAMAEVYPAQNNVVDECNRRHLWAIPIPRLL